MVPIVRLVRRDEQDEENARDHRQRSRQQQTPGGVDEHQTRHISRDGQPPDRQQRRRKPQHERLHVGSKRAVLREGIAEQHLPRQDVKGRLEHDAIVMLVHADIGQRPQERHQRHRQPASSKDIALVHRHAG